MDSEKVTTDVLIIGGGGAAAMAALAAKRQGASVTIVSKEASLVGGATIMAAGGTSAVLDPNDSPDVFFQDVMKSGKHLNNPMLVRALAENSKGTLLKLEEYGFLLDRNGLSPQRKAEGHSYPRGYLDRREGLGICHGLGSALVRSGVEFVGEVVVSKLLTNDGMVVGALGHDLQTGRYLVCNAKVTILATGGVGALYRVTTNARTLTGDGYAMGWDAGATLVDMEMVQFLPMAFPYPRSRQGVNIGMCSLFGPGVKLYNGLGERYMDKYDPVRMEFATRDVVARANYTEVKEGRGTKNEAIIVDTTAHDPQDLFRWQTTHPDICRMVRNVFGDRAADWKEPFEAIASQHFFMGGLAINENCETTVPGLLAAGEVTGGVHGANRLAGSALTEIYVFGDIGGKRAATLAKKSKHTPPVPRQVREEIDRLEAVFTQRRSGVRPFEIKRAIEDLMWSSFGPVRDGAGMKRAAEQLEGMAKGDLSRLALASGERKYNRERMEAIEVNMMVMTARFIAQSAAARRESRGSHFRADCPDLDDRLWLKNTAIDKGGDGEFNISYRRAAV